MGIDISMQTGYGFLINDLQPNFKKVMFRKQQEDKEDLTLFDTVEPEELTMEDSFEVLDEFHRENTLEECDLEVFGDYMSDGNYSIVVFLKNYEKLSLEDDNPEKLVQYYLMMKFQYLKHYKKILIH